MASAYLKNIWNHHLGIDSTPSWCWLPKSNNLKRFLKEGFWEDWRSCVVEKKRSASVITCHYLRPCYLTHGGMDRVDPPATRHGNSVWLMEDILYGGHIYTRLYKYTYTYPRVFCRLGAIHRKTDRSEKKKWYSITDLVVFPEKRWQNALKSSTISAYFFHLLAAIFGCCSLGLSNGFDQNVKHLQTLKWLPKPSQSHNFWHKF